MSTHSSEAVSWRMGRFMMDRAQSLDDEALYLYCPGGRDLPIEHLVALALLPIHDWNGELLKRLTIGPIAQTNITACVFAIDPFRRQRDLLQEVKQSNFRWVTNFPSTGIVDGGMRATLDDLGFGLEKELQFVEDAVSLGLGVVAFAATTSSAVMMIDRGATALVTQEPSLIDRTMLPRDVPVIKVEARR